MRSCGVIIVLAHKSIEPSALYISTFPTCDGLNELFGLIIFKLLTSTPVLNVFTPVINSLPVSETLVLILTSIL